MAKIVLFESPAPNAYRAIIGSNRAGWAYPLKKYKKRGTEYLEAKLENHGRSGTAVFRFVMVAVQEGSR